jgi:2-keto-4-pentenoate hydratase/2-oxohepta-3-ene-1,7-dioic acid hydratase in catechol pathway
MKDKKIVNKIIGIARNFSREGGIKDYPVLFSKPWSTLVLPNNPIKITKDLIINYELELGVMIGKECSRIKREEYLDYIGGYFLTLDLTEKSEIPFVTKDGGTWTICKGIDYLTPIGEFIDKSSIPDPNNVVLELIQNDKIVQLGNTRDLTYTIDEQIELISYYVTLYPGDLLLTGTFDNVNPINIGDSLVGNLYALSGNDSLKKDKKLVLDFPYDGKVGEYNGKKPNFSIEFRVEHNNEKIYI